MKIELPKKKVISDRKFDAAISNLTTVFLEILLASQQRMEIEFLEELILRGISASQV
jgi:hypothetical protein